MAESRKSDSQTIDRINSVENGVRPADSNEPGMNLLERMKHHSVPDVSFIVIDNDKIEFAKAYSIRKGEPVTNETLFQAASMMSKPVTAILALKLVDEGVLGLDEDVNKVFERYGSSYRIPYYENNQENKVTLRKLLSHTAGINVHGFGGYPSSIKESDLPKNAEILNGAQRIKILSELPGNKLPENEKDDRLRYVYDQKNKKLYYVDENAELKEKTFTDNVALFETSLSNMVQCSSDKLSCALTNEQFDELLKTGKCNFTANLKVNNVRVQAFQAPGKESYSGGGYQIVQQLIEVINKKTFAEVADELFKQLEMQSSTFEHIWPNEREPGGHLSNGKNFSSVAVGHLPNGESIPGKWRVHPESASIGLWSTPTDIAKLVLALRNNKILKKETVDEMLTPIPHTFFGLGPILNRNLSSEISHPGGSIGFRSEFISFKTNDGKIKAAIMMTNSVNGLALTAELKRSIADTYEWPNGYTGQMKLESAEKETKKTAEDVSVTTQSVFKQNLSSTQIHEKDKETHTQNKKRP